MLYTGFNGSRFVYKCKTVFRIVAYCMADEQNDLITIQYGLTVFHIMHDDGRILTQNIQVLSNH